MSLLFQRDLGDTSTQLTPPRTRTYGSVTVSSDSALRHSAVWACLRLRADLISSLPIETYRTIGGVQVDAQPSPFLLDPAGDGFGTCDWLYSSQFELDRVGNSFGIIRGRDGLGLARQVELVPNSKVKITGHGPKIEEFSISGTNYPPKDIWHERQFPVSGVPLGLSPTAYAAMSIATYLSAAQFAVDWFASGSIPAGKLKNVNKTISPKEARIAKERFKAAVADRDLFVHGADWEYDMISVAANESQFLEAMNYGAVDVCRFYGIPADLIDATTGRPSTKIIYANITQRNLQLLVTNLGPAIIRREWALSKSLPRPRFAKLNEKALLRMDPASLAAMLGAQITSRTLAPSEARAEDNRAPFTEEQMAEFDRLFPTGGPVPAGARAASCGWGTRPACISP